MQFTIYLPRPLGPGSKMIHPSGALAPAALGGGKGCCRTCWDK